MNWEVYRQYDDDDPPPEGQDWEPFAATAAVEHNGLRASQGGGYEVVGEVVWWRRRVKSAEALGRAVETAMEEWERDDSS